MNNRNVVYPLPPSFWGSTEFSRPPLSPLTTRRGALFGPVSSLAAFVFSFQCGCLRQIFYASTVISLQKYVPFATYVFGCGRARQTLVLARVSLVQNDVPCRVAYGVAPVMAMLCCDLNGYGQMPLLMKRPFDEVK